MMLQAFFDDSGNDPQSQFYVLAGFVGSLDTWSAFDEVWDYHLKKQEQPLEYFKMSEAMGFHEQFEGWKFEARKKEARNKLVRDLSDILGNADVTRVECFVKRSYFDDFIKNTIYGKSWDDPYFICFYHLCFSLAATPQLNWSPHYDIIFDEHGKLGNHAVFWWDRIKKMIEPEWAAKLGSKPLFRNDVSFKALQGADMYAWLVRDFMTSGGTISELASDAFKNIWRRPAISKMITQDECMQLGAGMLVAKSNMIRDFGTDEFVYRQSTNNFVRKKKRSK